MGKRKANMIEQPERKKICKETVKSQLGGTGDLEGTPSNKNDMARKRQRAAALQRPKLFLTTENLGVDDKSSEQSPSDNSTGDHTETKLPQLYIRDLQYLLIYALRRGLNYKQPRWCNLLRPGKMSSAVLVVLKNVSIDDFQQHSDCFPFLQATFHETLRVTMVNPCQYFSSFNFDMYAVPMSVTQMKGFKKKNGNTFHRNGVPVVFPKPLRVSDSDEEKPATVSEDRNVDSEEEKKPICRTQLLLSVPQMVAEKYPLPGEQDSNQTYEDFVMSKEKYAEVTSDSPMFAVDCEMCVTSTFRHELTRVSIVNEQNEVIYDELVKPYNPIFNYLTKYSGITKRLLDPVIKRIEDVQKEIRQLLPDDAILCGQSLGNDLCALKMFHPYVMDTSLIYNLSGIRGMKCSLKRLAYCFLGHVIQQSNAGHSSAEDAKATMDLIQLKLYKTLTFGDAVLGGNVTSFLPSFPSDPEPVMMRSLFDILNERNVSACQVGRERLVSKYQEEPALKCCRADSDQEACTKAGELNRDHKFTWVEFSALADLLAVQEQKETAEREQSDTAADTKQIRKALKKLDKHIKRLVEQLPEMCLVTVAMTGRGTQQHHEHAAAFLHIT